MNKAANADECCDTGASSFLNNNKKKKSNCYTDDPIWRDAWHKFSDQVKGMRGTVRKWIGCRVRMVEVSGKRKRIRRAVYDECNRRIQVLTVAELRKTVIGWSKYKQWKEKVSECFKGCFVLSYSSSIV